MINTNQEEEVYLTAANELASLLKNNGKVRVIYNMWDYKASISQPGPWVEKQFESADHVVLLWTPKGKSNLTKYQLSNGKGFNSLIAGMNATKLLKLKGKIQISLVYFRSADFICIPSDYTFLYNFKMCVRKFCLETKFKQFYHHVTGRSANHLSQEQIIFYGGGTSESITML